MSEATDEIPTSNKILFSAAHPNPGPLPGLEPWSLFGDVIGAIWAAPTTAIGLGLGTLGYAIDHIFGDGNATISFGNGGILFQNNPLMFNGTALTLGNAQIFSGLANDLIDPNNPSLGTFGAYEYTLTQQAGILGPFFLAIYVGGSLVAIINGDRPLGPGNPLERGPYGDPPSPWGG